MLFVAIVGDGVARVCVCLSVWLHVCVCSPVCLFVCVFAWLCVLLCECVRVLCVDVHMCVGVVVLLVLYVVVVCVDAIVGVGWRGVVVFGWCCWWVSAIACVLVVGGC